MYKKIADNSSGKPKIVERTRQQILDIARKRGALIIAEGYLERDIILSIPPLDRFSLKGFFREEISEYKKEQRRGLVLLLSITDEVVRANVEEKGRVYF